MATDAQTQKASPDVGERVTITDPEGTGEPQEFQAVVNKVWNNQGTINAIYNPDDAGTFESPDHDAGYEVATSLVPEGTSDGRMVWRAGW